MRELSLPLRAGFDSSTIAELGHNKKHHMDRLSSIVVGTDFSPCSTVAIGQALRLATWNRAKIHVAHIIDTFVVIDIENRLTTMQTAIRENLIADAQEAWKNLAPQMAPYEGASNLQLEVEINNRITGLIRLAAKAEADLLVLGAYGAKAPDVGIGTVATGCVRKAHCDVLLMRDTQSGPFKSIVVCIDFSDTSRQALERAARLAAQDGSQLHIVHIYDNAINLLPFFSTVTEAWQNVMTDLEKNSRTRLEAFCAELGPEGSYLKPKLYLATAATHGWGIIEAVKALKADLVVLGTRGRTNLRDILLGSTAERVLRESPCSILAIKPAGFTHPLSADETAATVPAKDILTKREL